MILHSTACLFHLIYMTFLSISSGSCAAALGVQNIN